MHRAILFEVYDVAIVGGRPAGLSAGMWSRRYLHSMVVMDSGDPRNWETRGINGFLGLRGIPPAELRGRGRDECRTYGAALIDAAVLAIATRDDKTFDLSLSGGRRLGAR